MTWLIGRNVMTYSIALRERTVMYVQEGGRVVGNLLVNLSLTPIFCCACSAPDDIG